MDKRMIRLAIKAADHGRAFPDCECVVVTGTAWGSRDKELFVRRIFIKTGKSEATWIEIEGYARRSPPDDFERTEGGEYGKLSDLRKKYRAFASLPVCALLGFETKKTQGAVDDMQREEWVRLLKEERRPDLATLEPAAESKQQLFERMMREILGDMIAGRSGYRNGAVDRVVLASELFEALSNHPVYDWHKDWKFAKECGDRVLNASGLRTDREGWHLLPGHTGMTDSGAASRTSSHEWGAKLATSC
ncbi:MAG: hypothetical protein RLZZ124_1906 [Cyanobacteriota bacterium]|jgi:hypothetical protein|nr:hypothetical protein [Actinomycetota bacterium]NBR68068.1 hypothetical protein [Actinomycetota bacterium]